MTRAAVGEGRSADPGPCTVDPAVAALCTT